jgi:hypothetical protein
VIRPKGRRRFMVVARRGPVALAAMEHPETLATAIRSTRYRGPRRYARSPNRTV